MPFGVSYFKLDMDFILQFPSVICILMITDNRSFRGGALAELGDGVGKEGAGGCSRPNT